MLIEEPDNRDVVQQILLNARIPPILVFGYVCVYTAVKKPKSWGQLAGVRGISTLEASQRLNAENLTKISRSFHLPLFTRSCLYSYSNLHLSTSLSGITKCFFSSKASTSAKGLTPLITIDKGGEACLPSGYVSGLSDGEGCFHIAFTKNSTFKAGFQVRAIFSIQLHIKDLMLLERIKSFFGVGTINIKKGKNAGCAIYSIQSYKELISVLVPHFDKYPLLTKKKADYLLFNSAALNILNNGEHLTNEGLSRLVSIKARGAPRALKGNRGAPLAAPPEGGAASMNLGLTEQLKTLFPDLHPVNRPIINNSSTLITRDPEWLASARAERALGCVSPAPQGDAGFLDAEGNFQCVVRKQETHKSGYQVLLSFTLTQHLRDLDLMLSIKEYLGVPRAERAGCPPPRRGGDGCGNIYVQPETSIVRLNITKKSELTNILIPFFKKYPLHGSKKLDFEDLCKIDGIIKDNLHKTKDKKTRAFFGCLGLDKINMIKWNMNRQRTYE
uniref:LAGLIDADG endonuclease n=1 Tax=Morchella brunnea TaxID=1174671 RepID=A0A8K1MHB4_9PEZI|nr:LAGLIDADG endonuclease [Morchella brunnea]UBU98521.1 LAGLIDADG endonuclease [Morchella brunnea]